MEAEKYFLRYAFPCAHVLVESGSISPEKLAELKSKVQNDEAVDRLELMMIFPSAFRRITQVAEKMKKDVWDLDVIKKYFLEEHNNFIDEKDGNYFYFGSDFRDFCKVYRAKIVGKNDEVLTVEFGERTRNVLADLVPEADVGDIVSIHQGFAVERFKNE